MYEIMKRIFFLLELKISPLRLRYALQAWINLLRLFLSPLNGLGLLSWISLGDAVEVISLSSLLSLVLYSDVLSCLLVVSWSDSGLGMALDVIAGGSAGRSGDVSGDEGGQKVLALSWGVILCFWLLIQ